MKFFHITTLFKIRTGYNHENYDFYTKLLEISNTTASKHIQESEYTRIIFRGEVDHIQDVFRQSLLHLYKVWKENYPCNILYTGPDVIFVKPVSFSDTFDKFMLFNYTDPRSGFGFEHYFNADVKYYPSTMDEHLWDIALHMEKEWPSYDFWDYEQTIWNKMLWAQKIRFQDVYRPQYNYMVFSQTDTDILRNNGGVSMKDAKVVHFCGTRRPTIEMIRKFIADVQ